MKNLDCFKQVLQDIEDYQLAKVFTFKHPWNRECILRFYSTLYVSSDRKDIKSGIMDWMTENHRVKCSALEFLDCLHFPWNESQNFETRLHFVDEISNVEFHMLMDSENVDDVLSYGSPKPEYLKFNY